MRTARSVALVALSLALSLVTGTPITLTAHSSQGTRTPAPNTERPPVPEAGIVSLPTGVTLDYVVQGQAGGPVVVLLHGAGDSWHSWDRVLPLLPSRYRVYAVTLRGHGRSDHPAAGFARADFVADVRAFMAHFALTGVTLVGHSVGSLVAQGVAESDSARVLARLVLVGSGPGITNPQTRRELVDSFTALRDPIDVAFARDFQMGTIHHAVPASFAETMVTEAMKVPAATWHGLAAFLGETGNREALTSIRVPTTVCWGDHDAIFSRADQQALVDTIPRATLRIYPDTGHALHWERPAEFVADLLEGLPK